MYWECEHCQCIGSVSIVSVLGVRALSVYWEDEHCQCIGSVSIVSVLGV